MSTGKKAQGIKGNDAKAWVIRHGHAPKRAPNTQEKALETKVRQAGKQECRKYLYDKEASKA